MIRVTIRNPHGEPPTHEVAAALGFEVAADSSGTLGAWGKTGRMGVGFHLRGDSELLLLYGKGAPRPLRRNLSGLYLAPREEHSRKPTTWLRRLVVELGRPSGPVLDLYAGSGPLASACVLAGRDYVGAEIDPVTHAATVARLGLRGAA